jgi:hypothetical protein
MCERGRTPLRYSRRPSVRSYRLACNCSVTWAPRIWLSSMRASCAIPSSRWRTVV